MQLSRSTETTMNTTRNIVGYSPCREILAPALIACSVLWHISACIYFATTGLGLDWSGRPLFWMLALVVTPAICFAGAILMVSSRDRSRLTLVERWSLIAAFLPVTMGTLLAFWAIKVLLVMSGM